MAVVQVLKNTDVFDVGLKECNDYCK